MNPSKRPVLSREVLHQWVSGEILSPVRRRLPKGMRQRRFGVERFLWLGALCGCPCPFAQSGGHPGPSRRLALSGPQRIPRVGVGLLSVPGAFSPSRPSYPSGANSWSVPVKASPRTTGDGTDCASWWPIAPPSACPRPSGPASGLTAAAEAKGRPSFRPSSFTNWPAAAPSPSASDQPNPMIAPCSCASWARSTPMICS